MDTSRKATAAQLASRKIRSAKPVRRPVAVKSPGTPAFNPAALPAVDGSPALTPSTPPAAAAAPAAEVNNATPPAGAFSFAVPSNVGNPFAATPLQQPQADSGFTGSIFHLPPFASIPHGTYDDSDTSMMTVSPTAPAVASPPASAVASPATSPDKASTPTMPAKPGTLPAPKVPKAPKAYRDAPRESPSKPPPRSNPFAAIKLPASPLRGATVSTTAKESGNGSVGHDGDGDGDVTPRPNKIARPANIFAAAPPTPSATPPSHYGPKERKQHFAVYQLRSLNESFKQQVAEAAPVGDLTGICARYLERYREIAETGGMPDGAGEKKRKASDDGKDAASPVKRVSGSLQAVPSPSPAAATINFHAASPSPPVLFAAAAKAPPASPSPSSLFAAATPNPPPPSPLPSVLFAAAANGPPASPSPSALFAAATNGPPASPSPSALFAAATNGPPASSSPSMLFTPAASNPPPALPSPSALFAAAADPPRVPPSSKSVFAMTAMKRKADDDGNGQGGKKPAGNIFGHLATQSPSVEGPKSDGNGEGAKKPAGNIFGNLATQSPSVQGPKSDGIGEGANKPAGNIFGHLATQSLFVEESESDEDAEEDAAKESSAKPVATGRSLFDRVSKPTSPTKPAEVGFSFGSPLAANGSAATPASSIFSTPTSAAGAVTFGSAHAGAFVFGAAEPATPAGPIANGASNGTSAAAASDDEAAEKLPQIDLTAPGAGEEDEDVVYQIRAKAMMYQPDTKEWGNKGVGPVRVLKNRETGSVRVLMRQDPRGSIIINTAVFKGGRYVPSGPGTMQMPVVGEDGKLGLWALKVKEPEIASKLQDVLVSAAATEA